LRNVLVMILLGAAAVASWIYSLPGPAARPERSSGGDAPLGYYVRGARLLRTDETGHVAYRILAQRLEERTDEERLLLEGVQIEYHPANEVPWIITAGNGSAPKDASRLDLGGGVELRSEPTDGSSPTHIVTDSLRFELKSSTAISDQRTELSVGDWHLSGKGLRAHLKDEWLRLESDVHGKFAR
jgi:LPS export ABC transporter protein LptC